jgi:ABC-2 type transport system permease protein
MRRGFAPGVLTVAIREIRWVARDGVALFLIVGVPLIAFSVLAWTFSAAIARDLHVTVVDADNSVLSRAVTEKIMGSLNVRLVEQAKDLNVAMNAIRSGAALGAVYLAPGFERDFRAGRRPQAVIFFNSQYYSPGSTAARGLRDSVQAAIGDLAGSNPPTASGAPGQLVVEQYVLSNPAMNYAQFLMRAVMPTILHVVMAISAVYVFGSEFSRRDRRAWFAAADGSPLVAFLGKLLPLFLVYILQMIAGVLVVHGLFGIPFRGDPVLMAGSALLFILAYLALGALLALLTRSVGLGLSCAGLICSPAFGFAGVGFPTTSMNAFARFWGDILPLRWYIQILFDQAARGLREINSAPAFSVLAGMAVTLLLLGYLRLRATMHRPKQPHAARHPQHPIVQSPGVAGAFVTEIRRVFADSGIFGLLVLAPLVYGFFYPQPYLNQLVRDVPVAIVDQDGTELSRQLIQNLDADEAIHVAAMPATISAANAELQAHRVYGILAIPAGTEREFLKGNPARLPAFVDSAYFLVFNRVLQGVVEGTSATTLDRLAHGARPDGSLASALIARAQPASVLTEPLYNPVGGYANYVVPAAFILIIQQTLLIGSAMLGGAAVEQGGRAAQLARTAPRAVLGQTLAHYGLCLPALCLYLVVLPRVYGFSTLGRPFDLLLMSVPFILAVSLLGQLAGAAFKRRETALLLFVSTSLPLFFMVGVSWPREAMPALLRAASRVIPSTSAIDAFLRLNQMGARLGDLRGDWLFLWAIAALFFAGIMIMDRLGNRQVAR